MPFRKDYTLIALVSAGSLLPAEPWDWQKSLETLASLSKDRVQHWGLGTSRHLPQQLVQHRTSIWWLVVRTEGGA